MLSFGQAAINRLGMGHLGAISQQLHLPWSSSRLYNSSPSKYPNMVSTRGHPKAFPEPDLTPSKSTSPSKSSTPSRARKTKWAHAPPAFAIVWLLVSLPLVAWDCGYVLLRPHSMPGGKMQWPLFVPYELYVKMDYIYGWKAYNEKNGFTSAQGFLNIIESLMYVYYLYLVFTQGRKTTVGRGAKATTGGIFAQRYVDGKAGASASLLVFTAAVMTLSKTILYCRFALHVKHVHTCTFLRN